MFSSLSGFDASGLTGVGVGGRGDGGGCMIGGGDDDVETGAVCVVKYLSFKLSRVRFVSEPHVHNRAIVVAGSWLEETNRLCLYQYDVASPYEDDTEEEKDEHVDGNEGNTSGRDRRQRGPVSEREDGTTPGVMGDSADEPRLLASLVHPGDVQEIKCHTSTGRIFSTSSTGALGIYAAAARDSGQHRLWRVSAPSWQPLAHLPVAGASKPAGPAAIAGLALSSDDAWRVFVADDLGRMAVVRADRMPVLANPASDEDRFGLDAVFQDSPASSVDCLEMCGGGDVTAVNALQRVDSACLASVNQVGQLKLWDMRVGFSKPQTSMMRPGQVLPLYCITQHPGQSHLLAVGGEAGVSSVITKANAYASVNGNDEMSAAAAYVWDVRADRYPLTELACPGNCVLEAAFHPAQPRHLCLATQTAGLLRVSCPDAPDSSWTSFQGCKRKLTVATVIAADCHRSHGIVSFALSHSRLVCGQADSCLHSLFNDTTFH